VIWFRQVDARHPFGWESPRRRPGRWHAAGEGPVQYLSDTPDGAWAEFLRHEGIDDPSRLWVIRRRLWAVEVPEGSENVARPRLFQRTLRGGLETYAACQEEARRIRRRGATAIEAPSAGLRPGGARGQLVRGRHLVEAPPRDGRTLALFGVRRELRGWACMDEGRPTGRVLELVNQL
jgi:RES domain-containing protein